MGPGYNLFGDRKELASLFMNERQVSFEMIAEFYFHGNLLQIGDTYWSILDSLKLKYVGRTFLTNAFHLLYCIFGRLPDL